MSTKTVIAILRHRNLLNPAIRCSECNQVMQQYDRPEHMDEFRMRCMTPSCGKRKSSVSLRRGSFFASCLISLRDYWTIICCWFCDVSVKDVVRHYDQSESTVFRIHLSLRRLVLADLIRNPVVLGGQGIVCAIDETLLSHKRKYNRGRSPREQVWCFGIADTSFSPAKCFMQIVPDRKRETLLPIIERVCRQGTVIHSDQWAAYASIQSDIRFPHYTVNHSTNFVDPGTGCHTQHIESLWNRFKNRNKAMNGMRRENLELFIAEFVWKDNNRDRGISALLGLLRHQD